MKPINRFALLNDQIVSKWLRVIIIGTIIQKQKLIKIHHRFQSSKSKNSLVQNNIIKHVLIKRQAALSTRSFNEARVFRVLIQ